MEPFYRKTWFIILMCFLFFPVGLYLTWKSEHLSQNAKICISIVVGLLVITSAITYRGDNSKDMNKEKVVAETEETPESEPEISDKLNNDEESDNSDADEDGVDDDARYIVVEKPAESDIITVSRRYLNINTNEMKGQWVRTAGMVTAINNNDDGYTYIDFEGTSQLKMIQCDLMSDQNTSNFSKGDYVTIVGKVWTKILGSTMLETCYIEGMGNDSKTLDDELMANDGISEGSTTIGGSSTLDTSDAIQISAYDVYQELESNQVACKSKYDGKIVAITGTIDDIGTTVWGQEYVTFDVGDPYSLDGVQCFFKNDQMDYVASLSKGSTITLYGYATVGSMTFKVGECRP